MHSTLVSYDVCRCNYSGVEERAGLELSCILPDME
jgi:hypothetical protein